MNSTTTRTTTTRISRSARRRQASRRRAQRAQQAQTTTTTTTTRPNTRTAKRGSRRRRGNRTNRAIRGNWYLQSLVDPCNSEGAKIPDGIMGKSQTFQGNDTITKTSADFANASLCVVFVPTLNLYYVPTAYAGGVYTWTGFFNPWTQPVGSLYNDQRVVSACIEFADFANMTVNGGFAVGWIQRLREFEDTASLSAQFPANPSNAVQFPGAIKGAARYGLTQLYRPFDNSDLEYYNPVNVTGTVADYVTAWAADNEGKEAIAIGIWVHGLTAGYAAAFQLTANYECISKPNGLMRDTPSFMKTGELEQAMNALSMSDMNHIGSGLSDMNPLKYLNALGSVGIGAAGGYAGLRMYQNARGFRRPLPYGPHDVV